MRIRSFISGILFLASLAPALLTAQDAPVVVSFEPLRGDWNWQSWAAELSADFESALSRRYREGLPRREFVSEKTPARLTFLVRIDQEGRIRRFVPLSPEHRYLAYLVESTAREIAPDVVRPPYGLPYPSVEGRMSFTLRFSATGFYKRHYFEEPIDSLDLPPFEPLIRTKDTQPLFLYEPPDMDKNKLLEEYRRRIGLNPGIQDTSIYSPLDLRGMYLAVTLPFDSLRLESMDTLRLRREIERAVEQAGAHVLEEMPVEDYSSAPSTPEAAQLSGDSLSLSSDSAVVILSDSSAAAAPDSSTPTVAPARPSFMPGDSSLPVSDLPKSFAKVVNLRRALVLSAGLARDSLPGRALCRVRLFELRRPDDFKRRLDYGFTFSGSLPDTLGRLLVGLLVSPPPKPEPPKPKTPPAAKTAVADSTAKTAADSTAAKADSTGAAKPAPKIAPDTSAAKADTSASAKPAPAAAKADSTAAAVPKAVAAQPVDSTKAAPADSTAKAPATAPAAVPDTVKASAAPQQQAIPAAMPVPPEQSVTPADSTKPPQ